MKRWPSSAITLALLCGAAGIAAGQQTPESLLPPGFGDPPPPAESVPPAEGAPVDLLPPAPGAAPADPLATPEGAEGEEETEEEEEPEPDIPDYARRDPDRAGPLTPLNGGLGADAFGRSGGRALAGLMRRLDAPIASRWASILLRRALLSRTETPRGIAAPDWVAERAWLLLRMGEADAARLLVAEIEPDRMSPRMVEVAAQVALATSDPAGLCPLVAVAPPTDPAPIWPLASAICTAFGGEGATAGALLDRARARTPNRGIDLLLAEKAVGAASQRRAVMIEWTGVDRLTAWRYGLATALNVPIPAALFETVGPHVLAWAARAPATALTDRVAAARMAAALGPFSSAALVDLYSAIYDQTDPAEVADTDPARLRAAFVGEPAARLGALRRLWAEGDGAGDGADADAPDDHGRDRYSRLILTARAAARIAPDAGEDADVAKLIGAMFSAGLDRQAARWAPRVAEMDSAEGDAAWSILAVGSPRPVVQADADRIEAFAERATPHRTRLLIAALAGVGRLPIAEVARLDGAYGARLGMANIWTDAIGRAAARGERGTVALLVGLGMQTPGWRGVPPAFLYRALMALRAVGLDGEARMIAAEAMTRA